MTFLVFLPAVWGTQEHADPEGLYSHQIAHLFFLSSMAVLIFQIKRTSPLPKSWRYIGLAALLFLLWNLDTFTVHLVREKMSSDLFAGSVEYWTQTIDVSALEAKVYYVGRILDHILSVGAIIAFIYGIKSFKEESMEEK